MNRYQNILIIIFSLSLAFIPESIAVSAQEDQREYQIVQALSSPQINLRAKQITVRIDGDNSGSGIIINSLDDSYTVLTNWHIVKDLGNYNIQTVDGRQHQVPPNTIKRLSNLDLAILQFTSPQNYQIAEVGESNNLSEGQSIYFAGYPSELRTERDRIYRFFSANIVGLLNTPTANGYSVIYDGSAFPGMSGGPLLNDQGFLIGIHGETNIHAVTGATSNYAIPINVYQTASTSNDNNSTIATTTSNNQPKKPNNENRVVIPETVLETNDSQQPIADSTESEEPNNEQIFTIPETIIEPNNIRQPTAVINPSTTNSVPVFSSPQNQEQNLPITTSNDLDKPNKIDLPQTSSASNQINSSGAPQSKYLRERNLISTRTGIDYAELQNLLAQEKWREADRLTKQDISNVFQTIKRKNNNRALDLRTIADRACYDLSLMDSLWRNFSGDRFGFRFQQNIWQNLNQNNNFSIDVWRSFVTEIGWKTGDINNPSGYVLYEQLTFNPQKAPVGSFPWWFDYSSEQKNVMRQVLTRCNL